MEIEFDICGDCKNVPKDRLVKVSKANGGIKSHHFYCKHLYPKRIGILPKNNHNFGAHKRGGGNHDHSMHVWNVKEFTRI